MFDVVTIGTATRDAFVRSKDFYIEREGHVLGGQELAMPLGAKIEIEKIVFTTGGGATNSAVTFARQGLKTAVMAAVGDDVSGRAVIEELAKEHVATAFIRKDKKEATAYSILLHPEGGERTVLVYRGASENLSASDIQKNRPRSKWFYVSSLAGNLDLLRAVVSYGARHKILIAYNPGGKELKQKKKLIPLLRRCDVLILNREEAARITGASYGNIKEILRKLDALSPGINVTTDARKGVWVSNGKNIFRAGIYKEKKVVDRTGAGDAFGSGFVAALIEASGRRGYSSLGKIPPAVIQHAIRLGSANATAKVEGIGAKYGLLKKNDFFRDPRWRTLPLKIIS